MQVTFLNPSSFLDCVADSFHVYHPALGQSGVFNLTR